MPRKTLIRTKDFPYHITGRANNREPFHLNLNETWCVLTHLLGKSSVQHQTKVHAFVLMPNHFHLILTTPKEDLGIVMREFMRSATKTINKLCGRSGRVFGAKYHWSMIEDFQYYDCALKYVFRNPVKAGLADRVEDYSFSSLHHFLKQQQLGFELYPPSNEPSVIPNQNLNSFLTWMNQPFQYEQDEHIKKSLMKKKFRPLQVGWKRTTYRLDRSTLD